MKYHALSFVAVLVLAAGVAKAQRQPVGPIGGPIGAQTLQRLNLRSSINANLILKSPSIAAARGNLGGDKLNQLVTVRGFYYDGSIPMVVDSIERTQCNTAMPPASYVPLVSRIANLRNGDEVSIAGRLVTPVAAGLRLDDEESVLRLEGDEKAAVKVERPNANTLLKFDRNIRIRIPDDILIAPTEYAVLISGGINAANNHIRYWNDLKTMYAILRQRGYAKSNITVIFADGVAKDDSMPVNSSATKANITAAFKSLAAKMSFKDNLYVMMNDHGGGFLAKKIGDSEPGSYGGVLDTSNSIGMGCSEQTYNRDFNYDGDKNDVVHFHSTLGLWGELMTENEFAAALDQIKESNTTMIQMEQCFSGAFTQALRAPKRIVMSAAGPNEFSWGHSSGNYNEFTYHYFAGLTGKVPGGSTTVNADANNNKKISMVEAWNYARTNDTAGETGLYADTGSNPASGNMPAGGQGTLGANTVL